MKLTIDDVRSRFIKHFDGSTGSVYASPGRINLIGEHTDYNNGFVFPGAVEQGIIAEIKPNGTRKVYADVYMDDKDARFRRTVAEEGYDEALEYLEYSVRKVVLDV